MKVLIVIDMQNDFITGSLANPFAQEIVEPIAEKIRNFDGAILFTKDSHKREYLSTQEGKFLPVEHCIELTEGWDISPTLLDAVNNRIYEKKKWQIVFKNEFGCLHLPANVRAFDRNVESIELCGTVASICVVSNALILKAAFPEVPVIVNKNLIADITEEGKQSALTVMKNCQVILED